MKPREALSDGDYRTLADFRHAIRRFLAFSEDEAAAPGMTPQQHQALLIIRAAGNDGATVGLIAERLILKPHSATGLVGRLEALGLLTGDRKSVRAGQWWSVRVGFGSRRTIKKKKTKSH